MDSIYKIIERQVNNEDGGLWFWNQSINKLIIKVPTHTAKAVFKGKSISLYIKSLNLFSRNILFSGVSIDDFDSNPIELFGINQFKEEIKIIRDVFKSESLNVDIFNELGICVLTGIAKISDLTRKYVFEELDKNAIDNEDFIVAPYLDFFEKKILSKNDIQKVKLNLEKIQIINNHFIGANISHFSLDNINEGSALELEVLAALDGIFKEKIYHSPYFINGTLKKELTDLFAISEYGVFIFETKCMAILQLEKENSVERRVANVQKQIKKALKQVSGVCRNIKNNKIFNKETGEEIIFNRNLIPHCVIIIDELLPFGEWEHILLEVMETMLKDKSYINILDVIEFMKLVKASASRPHYLDYNLMNRTETFVKTQSLFIKGVPEPNQHIK